MEAVKAESVHLPSPPGVEFAVTEQGVRVRARAGSINPLMTVAFIVSAIAAGAGLYLPGLIADLRAGTRSDAGPTIFVCAVVTLAGLYCAALCLWTMIGHETLVIRNGRLLLGNPWLLGLKTRRLGLSKVRAFSCAGKDCGVHADEKSCCCTWSSVDYALVLESDGRRSSIFTQLPREAKDWLRDRLNGALAQKQLPGV